MSYQKSNFSKLKVKDIESLAIFKRWLIDNLNIYDDPSDISPTTALIFIRYVEELTDSTFLKNKKTWMLKLKDLKDMAELYKRKDL